MRPDFCSPLNTQMIALKYTLFHAIVVLEIFQWSPHWFEDNVQSLWLFTQISAWIRNKSEFACLAPLGIAAPVHPPWFCTGLCSLWVSALSCAVLPNLIQFLLNLHTSPSSLLLQEFLLSCLLLNCKCHEWTHEIMKICIFEPILNGLPFSWDQLQN